MKNKTILHLGIQILCTLSLYASYEQQHSYQTSYITLTNKEEFLIDHIQKSIANAEQGISSLSKEVLAIQGMSSPKVRHLLNNLCSLPKTNYLEIGCWQGSTWVAALYNNASTISSAIAIDNWSEFRSPKLRFRNNCNYFLKGNTYQFIEEDCFKVNLNHFSSPVNIYFYDGFHDTVSQEKAFTYFNDILDDTFIAVVDDWNFPEVPVGTFAAFEQLGYTIVFQKILPARWNGDTENWWNGIFIAVIRKTN